MIFYFTAKMNCIFALLFLNLAVKTLGVRYVKSPVGNLLFYENRHTVNYYISLTSFYKGAEKYENNLMRLNGICMEMNSMNQCNGFLDTFRDELKIIKSDVKMIKNATRKRKRRNIWLKLGTIGFNALKLGGKGLVFSGGAYGVDKLIGTFGQSNNEVISNSVHNDRMMFENFNRKMTEKKMIDDKTQEYNDLIKGLMTIKSQHIQSKSSIGSAFSKNIREELFNIIDFSNFTSKIEETNKILSPDFSLPKMEVNEIIELSKVVTYVNETDIKVSIEIPIIKIESPSIITEIIPVPFSQSDNNTALLNLNSELYIKNGGNEKFFLPRNVFDECKHSNEVVLCNSREIDSLETPNKCLDSLINERKP